MSVYVGDEDWRSDLIQKWEYFYFDSLDTEKTSRVTFSETNQVHEIQTENEASTVGKFAHKLRRSKRKSKKNDLGKAVEMLKFSSLSLDGSLPADVNYKILMKKLRKFRTTSWVVRVCTDFVQPVPVLQVSTLTDFSQTVDIVDIN